MATIKTIEKKILKYLDSVELEKLNMHELNQYIWAVNTLDSLLNPNFNNLFKTPPLCGFAVDNEKEEK